jgi:hypothetical protein
MICEVAEKEAYRVGCQLLAFSHRMKDNRDNDLRVAMPSKSFLATNRNTTAEIQAQDFL